MIATTIINSISANPNCEPVGVQFMVCIGWWLQRMSGRLATLPRELMQTRATQVNLVTAKRCAESLRVKKPPEGGLLDGCLLLRRLGTLSA